MGVLCITLPKASSTACDVKFSEGMRLMKCFCRLFSYILRINEDPLETMMRRDGRLEYNVLFGVCHRQQGLPLQDLQPTA